MEIIIIVLIVLFIASPLPGAIASEIIKTFKNDKQ